MTLQQLANLLASLNYDIAYSHFDKTATLPFLIYREMGTENFGADNKVFKKIKNVEVELCLAKKDLKVEKQLEDLLDSHSIFYDVDEFFIESENYFRRIYYINLI